MKLYRYRDVQFGSCDEYENIISTRVAVEVMEFDVVKETRCGAWIHYGCQLFQPDVIPPRSELKFVNFRCRKQFACRTKEEALASFVARKQRQISILNAKLRRAKEALAEANGMIGNRQPMESL